MLIYLQVIESDSERSKFEQLYIKYRVLMFYVAMKIVENESDAEDAVHQAFLSVAGNMDKVGRIDAPETQAYVVTITERKAIDILRGRRMVPTDLNEADLRGQQVPTPCDHGLADAMAGLPANYRTVLLLRYYNGYSTGEVAEILQMSRSAAQKLLWRAKKELKKKLEEGAQ